MSMILPLATSAIAGAHPEQFSAEQRLLGRLKFEILAKGVDVSAEAGRRLTGFKPPIRTRSGVSGGIDIALPQHVYVNCPIGERPSRTSDLVLDWAEDAFFIRRGRELLQQVRVLPRPTYYDGVASDGARFVDIGQLCSGDRICIGMTRHCFFWKREIRCKFCSIGLNARREAAFKTPENVAEAVLAAAHDPLAPARHVLIGGGTPLGEDRGALQAAALCQAIKARIDIPVYVMIVPPDDDAYLEVLRDAGVDELGMNIEFFDPDVLAELAPGKHDLVGHRRYFAALEQAVELFGPVNTRSIVIVGIESPEATLRGCEDLAAMGVMPILSPFRPLAGTDMAEVDGFSPELYFDVFSEAQRIALRHGVVVGPTCIPCQNNTLALPFGAPYRHY